MKVPFIQGIITNKKAASKVIKQTFIPLVKTNNNNSSSNFIIKEGFVPLYKKGSLFYLY